jgi:MFS family permease
MQTDDEVAGDDSEGLSHSAGTESPVTDAQRPAWRRALAPNVLRLGLVSFFADVSSEMLYPLMPLFLTVTLGAPASIVGVIEGAAEALASLLKTVSGRIADRTGRRVELVFGGYSLSALAKPLIALAHSWPLVLVARLLDRTGKGFRGAPRDALIADSIEPEVRGAAFGWHRAMDTLGAVVGPLIALGLLTLVAGDIRRVILLAAIPGMIGALLVFTVSDPWGKRKRIAGEPATPVHGSRERLRWSDIPRGFKQYLGAWLPFVLVNSSDVFLILRAKQIGFSTTAVVIVYTVYNLVYALASVPLGHLSDRLGRRQVLVGGLVIFAVLYAGFSFAAQIWHVAVLFALYGLYVAATDGVSKAFVVDLVPRDLRATSFGLLGTLTGVATLLASSIAGVLWDTVGPWAPFAVGAIGALVSAMLFAFLPGLRRPAVTRSGIAEEADGNGGRR